MSGKVFINLISSKLLEELITSGNLGLPEGYVLAAGTHQDSLTWYYEALKAVLLTDAHRLLIVILIPLKILTVILCCQGKQFPYTSL
jgi:hypothetical protein